MYSQKFLITGHKNGLGRFLYEYFGGIGFDRNMPPDKFEHIRREGVDVIIHCAFNSAREINSKNLYPYLSDNVFLTKRLAKIPHKKFIFISSVDVYPKDNKKHSESEVIDVNQVSGIYAITKLMSESIVQNICPNFLILRCSTLLGHDSRENSLIKIIKEASPALALSADSLFNYILHKDVLEFIQIAIKKDLQGIYNLSSSKNITLSQISELLGKKVNFGKYKYNVGNIDNNKITSIFPTFKKTSREAVLEFLKLTTKERRSLAGGST
ncbi:MAG: NAD-dependent epimerase/dehydratase family protein [Patescibacteria group bacterium]